MTILEKMIYRWVQIVRIYFFKHLLEITMEDRSYDVDIQSTCISNFLKETVSYDEVRSVWVDK